MSQQIPQTVRQWNVMEGNSFDALKLSEQPLEEVGDNQVLVKSKPTTTSILWDSANIDV